MPQISYTGAFNAATLSVADLYINVQLPDTGAISPATFGVVALVGVASWGPVNKAVPVSTNGTVAMFGNPTVRTADLVTHANIVMQIQQAAGIGYKLILCRVTDTTDTAAIGTLLGLKLTSFYTGTLGNTAIATLAAGSNSTATAPTWTLTLQMGSQSEVFANVPGNTTTLWAALMNVVNNGQGVGRGPSQLVTAALVTGTLPAPAAAVVTLAGGTDGASAVTSAQFVGVDGTTESGIYAFRGLGCSLGVIADFEDDTQLPTLVEFAQSEGIYVVTSGEAGETPTEAQTALLGIGVANPWIKRMVGDWIYWADNYNGLQRVLAPATFFAAQMSTYQPGNSGLNKQVASVVATQKSTTGNIYSTTDLATMTGAGLDVICKPIPAGNVFGIRTGQNTSQNVAINGDNYPLVTSFLVRSIAGSSAVGQLIGQEMTDDFYTTGYDLMYDFLATLVDGNIIEAASVQFSAATVTAIQAALGISAMMVQAQYLGISRILLINLQGGQTVVIDPSVAPAQIQQLAQAA